MDVNLLKTDDYCLLTFSSTSQALKAEEYLKNMEAEFIIIPTLREITASCGLSIKMDPGNLKRYYTSLVNQKIAVEAVYRVKKINDRLDLHKCEDLHGESSSEDCTGESDA